MVSISNRYLLLHHRAHPAQQTRKFATKPPVPGPFASRSAASRALALPERPGRDADRRSAAHSVGHRPSALNLKEERSARLAGERAGCAERVRPRRLPHGPPARAMTGSRAPGCDIARRSPVWAAAGRSLPPDGAPHPVPAGPGTGRGARRADTRAWAAPAIPDRHPRTVR